jgi:predicted RNA-binding Zn-ribbon protein involved in translation (DUF1610 family)
MPKRAWRTPHFAEVMEPVEVSEFEKYAIIVRETRLNTQICPQIGKKLIEKCESGRLESANYCEIKTGKKTG